MTPRLAWRLALPESRKGISFRHVFFDKAGEDRQTASAMVTITVGNQSGSAKSVARQT
jgi:hypothetical protein